MDGQAHTAAHWLLSLRSQDQQASIARWEGLPPLLRLLVNKVDQPGYETEKVEYVRNCGYAGKLPTAAWRPAPQPALQPALQPAPQPVPQSALAFPFVLFQIMETLDNSEWLRWSEDGTEVQFNSWPLMIAALNARGMTATKKESVSKNFHDYEFQRLNDMRQRRPDEYGVIWHIFKHDNFKRGRPDLVRNIRRQYQRPRST